MHVKISVGEKPVWLGQPQPFLPSQRIAQPKLKKLAGPFLKWNFFIYFIIHFYKMHFKNALLK